MAVAIARRWRCCEASILFSPKMSISLRSVGCFFFFFFLVFWLIMGVGRWVLTLIELFFFLGSLVGFNDLAADWVGDDLA